MKDERSIEQSFGRWFFLLTARRRALPGGGVCVPLCSLHNMDSFATEPFEYCKICVEHVSCQIDVVSTSHESFDAVLVRNAGYSQSGRIYSLSRSVAKS